MRILEEVCPLLNQLNPFGEGRFAVSFYKRVVINAKQSLPIKQYCDAFVGYSFERVSNSLRIILVILVIFTYLYATTIKTREKQYYGVKVSFRHPAEQGSLSNQNNKQFSLPTHNRWDSATLLLIGVSTLILFVKGSERDLY
jgi:hypothetical protein